MGSDNIDHRVRLDKWLWAARFYKTRSIAKAAIEGGKVHYNQHRTKPGKMVEEGATIRLKQGPQEKVVVIDRLSDVRRGAPEAQTLYHETEYSQTRREEEQWRRRTMQAADRPPARRPNKKDRREIRRFKDQHGL